jgi:hypothetical protein
MRNVESPFSASLDPILAGGVASPALAHAREEWGGRGHRSERVHSDELDGLAAPRRYSGRGWGIPPNINLLSKAKPRSGSSHGVNARVR